MQSTIKIFFPLVFVFSLFVAGCNNRSDTTILSQADTILQQATIAVQDNDLSKAEHFLTQGIELLNSIDNKPKLAEAYTSLASVQLSLGKPSAALSSYAVVRDLYGNAADRNSEIPVMIEMGRLYFQVGMAPEAVKILEEALLASQLYQFTNLHAEASLALGSMYVRSNKPQRANSYFTQAGIEFLRLADTAKAVVSFAGEITSLIQMKQTTEAKQVYNTIEPILFKNLTAEFVPDAFTECGFAFIDRGNSEFARSLFRNALLTSNLRDSYRSKKSAVRSHIGLGEVYLHSYAFADAQKEFITAYNLQKKISENAIEAYILIRIADCNRMQYTLTKPQQAIIRANQLYENALTLFSRLHFGFGEAIALHRIGMMKEIGGDDNAAIPYYKRAIEKFVKNNIRLQNIPISIDFTRLISTGENDSSPVDWFTEQLIGLLLKYHRAEEGMKYTLLRSSLNLQDNIILDEVQFRNKEKQHTLEVLLATQKKTGQLLYEIYYAGAVRNKSYSDQLIQQREQLEKVQSQQSAPPIPWYVKDDYTETSFLQSINPSATVLQYQMICGECWVMIANTEQGFSAVRLSRFGYELEKKMKYYIAELSSQKKNLIAINSLSEELYSILVEPVEKFGKQRFIIIPVEGLEKFPFHTLTKNGRSLLDMIEVSYLPSPAMLGGNKLSARNVANISAVGFSSDSRWGLEFELRDIRSFFRNTQISLNQNATKEQLEKAEGDLLQISSPFRSTADNDYFVTLSDGSTSPAGITIPISIFSSLYSFPFVYLSDVQSKANNITIDHALYWFMNDASGVISTEFPITPRTGKLFEENFYSALSSNTPYKSYRNAMLQFNSISETASFFYYGF